MANINYNFDVEIVRYGQARKYADSIYEYIIKSHLDENLVKLFCIHVLKPISQMDTYNFKKIDNNTYSYYVCIPFMD